jgi:DNA-binding FrmR family transcriptional regulator
MEKNQCCHKTTKRSEDEKKLITNRLNRINGQINGINKMIENDAYCNDVLIQLSAVENSIQSLSNHILENHLYTCVTRDLEKGDLDTIDEIISLFKRFNK